MEVKQERTGWRDEALSKRHRDWGWDCPAVDIDFLMIEYDKGKSVALVEYKNEHATTQNYSHPSYRAMVDLADRAGIPAFMCRYTDNLDKWTVDPINQRAKEKLKGAEQIELTEKRYVKFLYWLRGREVPDEIMATLKG
jgi:hypothetical protein